MDVAFQKFGLWKPTPWQRLKRRFGWRPIVRVDGPLRAVLAANFEDYLRAGGVVTWGLWGRLSQVSRAALIVAADRVALERGIASGVAAHGPRQAAALMADIDDGDMQVRLALEAAMARIDESLAAPQRSS